MLYCTKCRTVCADGLRKCPNCKSERNLRAIRDEDTVLLHRMDEYTASCLANKLDELSVPYETEPFQKGRVSYLYDGETLPTDKNFYVSYRDYQTVSEIAAQVERDIDEERSAVQEDFEDMPRRKRIIVQVVSVLAFLILIMAAVFGADFVANWIRSFFT